MVSSLLVESLSSPTDVLLSFYNTYDHDAINEFPKAVAKHFSDIFRTKDAFSEVRPTSTLIFKANSHPRYPLSPPYARTRTAIALLSGFAPWSKIRLRRQRFTYLNCEMGNVAAGACQIHPNLGVTSTSTLLVMIYEIALSCGPSAFPERRNGIACCRLRAH